MQTPSDPTQAAALSRAVVERPVRVVRHHIRIDFDNDWTFDNHYSDVSEIVQSDSITLDQAKLTTDVPEEINPFVGYSSNELTFTLQGTRSGDTLAVSEWISRFRTDGPFFDQRLEGRWVKYNVAEETDAGPVPTRRFTGIVRKIEINRATGTVKLTCNDALIYSTSTVILPHWAVDSSAGSTNWDARRPINSSWVFEEIMRQCNTPVGPPARSGCAFYASMDGSMLPSVGALDDFVFDVGGESHGLIPSSSLLMTQGRFGPTLAAAPAGAGAARFYSHNMCRADRALYVPADGTGDGPVNVGFTFWAYSDGTATRTIPAYNEIWYDGLWTGLSLTRARLTTDFFVQVGSNGQVWAKITDRLANPRWGWSAQPAGWHAYNVLAKFRNNSIQLELRVDGVLQGSASQGEGNQSQGYRYGVSSTPIGIPPRVQMVRYDLASHLQIYWGGAEVDWVDGQDYPTTQPDGLSWADWTGNLSELSFIPDTTYENAWALLQKLANSEFAMLRIDEWGRPRYRAAYDWHNTRDLDGVRTFTVDNIEDMVTAPTFDQFATRLEMPYVDRKAVISETWRPTSSLQMLMPPNAVTQHGPYNPPEPVIRGTTAGTMVSGWSDASWRGKSWPQNESYAAAVLAGNITVDATDRNHDGSSADALTIVPSFFWSTDKREVVIQAATTNWSATDPIGVYFGAQLVESGYSSTDPKPGILFSLKASVYSDLVENTHVEQNDDAVLLDGVVTLKLERDEWRQTVATAQALAPLLLDDVANPVPVVEGFAARLDQRLQIGDVIVLDPKDSYSSTVRAQIVGMSQQDAMMRLDLRLVATPSRWILGVAGSSELGVTTVLA